MQILRRLLIRGEFPLLRKFYVGKDANLTVFTYVINTLSSKQCIKELCERIQATQFASYFIYVHKAC